ncbi:hypothetical protein [Cloacibacterium normanense]|uniref:hypothetical protein n=1 Tax=Cloacibacterium normanense TaxID=237258 RepID=UPI00352E749A
MKNILITIFIFSASIISAQIAPPPLAKPLEENKQLIDELITTTNFEKYFSIYCKSKIEQSAKDNNWEENKKLLIISNINFKYFKDTIYNTFSKNNKKELKDLINLLRGLNSKYPDMVKIIPMNLMMQNNLDLYIDGLTKDKY